MKRHRSPAMALIDRLLADVLAVAIRATPRFPRELRRSWFPASAIGAPKHSATNNKQLAVVSVAAQKTCWFPPSRPPARYSTGYKARRSPCAHNSKHVPADLITVVNSASPHFSREIRGSCFRAFATRAQKHSKTTYKLSAVVSVAPPKTFRFRAEPILPTRKPSPRGSPTARDACRNPCRYEPVNALKWTLQVARRPTHGVRTDHHRPRIQSLASSPEHASQQAPQKRASVFQREQTGPITEKTIAVSGARCQTRKGGEEGGVASP